jgi:hypothetical protein
LTQKAPNSASVFTTGAELPIAEPAPKRSRYSIDNDVRSRVEQNEIGSDEAILDIRWQAWQNREERGWHRREWPPVWVISTNGV